MTEDNRNTDQDAKSIIYNLAKECKGDTPNERVDAFLEKYNGLKNNFNEELSKIKNALVGDNKSALLALASGSNNPLVDGLLRKYLPEGRFKEELCKMKDVLAPIEKYGIATNILNETRGNNGVMDIFGLSKKNPETPGQDKNPDEDKRAGIISILDGEAGKIGKALENEKESVVDALKKNLL